MKELRYAASKNTPEVVLSPDGTIRVKGRSIHENVAEFFAPIENWVIEYIENPADITQIDVNLEYFNSASAKVFIHIFQKITYVALKNKKYVFNWFYEEGDEDIYERGEYFSSILDVPFNFIKIS
ncbi:MAG TPA: DUF1987 domain-containing protein [Bacteroidales bacterium]|nr:DUF1987 domain-containing protein [Bacteroidales bacterium]